MKVETYEVEQETSEIAQLAADGEAAMLIEKLGLNGQLSLMNKETGTMLPYRLITAEEKVVFEALFPRKCLISEYKDGPIPVRVLQVAAFVKDLYREDMACLQVWYPPEGKDDPVLVARKSDWQSPIYLLARWGAALIPFDELREKAIATLAASARVKLNKAQQEVNTALLHIEDNVRNGVLSGEAYAPYVNV